MRNVKRGTSVSRHTVTVGSWPTSMGPFRSGNAHAEPSESLAMDGQIPIGPPLAPCGGATGGRLRLPRRGPCLYVYSGGFTLVAGTMEERPAVVT